jgi:hypothetical protein
MYLLKITFIVLLFFSGLSSYAQLPTIYAKGGEGTNIDWETMIKMHDKNAEEGDLPLFYNDCLREFTVTKASSVLAAQGKKNYQVKNLSDEDPTTAWIPNSKNRGIGESFEILSRSLDVIYNGYQTNPTVWMNNARVKKLKVYKDNIPLCFLQLTDEMGAQAFELPVDVGYLEEPKSAFRFEIVEVYKGAKFQDVALSEIEWSGCCFAENTSITTDNTLLSVDALKIGESITSIDLETGARKETKILRIAQQKHVNLLVISTPTRSITITANHPLYMKGYGFISFSRLKEIMRAENYIDLIGSTELLIWNKETGKPVYEKLSSVSIKKALVPTYTIKALSEGRVFIANGFVTTTY